MDNIVVKNTGDSLTAAEYNGTQVDLQNAIESSSQTLGANAFQTGRAMAKYGAGGGAFYVDASVAADTFVLNTPVSGFTPIDSLFLGLEVQFVAAISNTGNCTANVNSTGAKKIFNLAAIEITAADTILAGSLIQLIFIPSLDSTNGGYLLIAALGDVTGPAGAISGNLFSFGDTSGKLAVDSGISAASLVFPGEVIQQFRIQIGTISTSQVTTSSIIVPPANSGTIFMTIPFTPILASSILFIQVIFNSFTIQGSSTGSISSLHLDSGIGIAGATSFMGSGNESTNMAFTHFLSSGSTTLKSFTVRGGPINTAGTLYFNAARANPNPVVALGGIIQSSITISEMKP